MRQKTNFTKAAILAWARDEGPDKLDSFALEEILEPLFSSLRLAPGILEDLTGVKTRRLYPHGSPPSRGAIKAAQNLFLTTGYRPEDMDLIYSTSVGRDYLEPSTASIIHSQLELPEGAANLDLGSACLGFIDGIYLAALQVEMGLIDRALVVAGENARPLLENTLATLLSPGIGLKDFFRHFASLTLGSGGAAMVVGSSEENPRAPRLRGFVSMTDPASNDLCRGDITGMETDPALLMTRGVLLAKKTFEKGRELYGWDPLGFDLIVCHQVSYANTLRFAETLSLAWDKIPLSYPQYGNMGPVAIPFTFSLAFDQGRILAGSQVALMGIGSGLTCAMLELTIP